LQLAIAGMLALAAAIGIGRFAFTPLLPMMQNDAGLTLQAGAWLAAANYLGYFAGALSAVWIRAGAATVVRAALVSIAVLSVAMGIVREPIAWLLLRGLAGIASAWALVFASAFVLQKLAATGRAQLGGLVFGGVGLGTTLAGGLCLVFLQGHWRSDRAWIALGLVALLLAVAVWRIYSPDTDRLTASGHARSAAQPPRNSSHLRPIICYGCFGFGYIIPATFLPAMARQAVDDPLIFGWAWPMFGLAALASALAAGRLSIRLPYRVLWLRSHLIMALGVALPIVWSGVGAIALSALFVGGTFMVATMAGMQEARRVAPDNSSSLMAAMTAAFAFGQILGPLLVSAVANRTWGMELSLATASLLLALSAAALCRR
jgi:predicted MFS family arabinose efflux permease